MNIKGFEKDFLLSFKKLKLNKNKNVYVTSNLTNISKIRIPKQKKLELIFNSLTKTIGKNYTIFVPGASLNLCNSNIPFDLENTPSHKMGPLAEFIRNKKSIRSMHPFWSICGIGQNSKILKNVSKHAYGYGSPWSKMLDLDFLQLNIGMHPSKAVTLIHHIETIIGVPYRYSKLFKHKIRLHNKTYYEDFYQSVFFNEVNSKKKIKLNEHFFEILKKKKKLNYFKHSSGLEMWSFKMKDFFKVATDLFKKDIFTYLEFKPNLSKISKY
ncbi:AAC(3) family N-acetyltransferase [Candidatus Pelagibacter bacterium]|nr:AAC(3) family N-acetyltransferase [Candidatus Pelagibacter bacterium]